MPAPPHGAGAACPGSHVCPLCGARWYHAWAACRIRDDATDRAARCPTHVILPFDPPPPLPAP